MFRCDFQLMPRYAQMENPAVEMYGQKTCLGIFRPGLKAIFKRYSDGFKVLDRKTTKAKLASNKHGFFIFVLRTFQFQVSSILFCVHLDVKKSLSCVKRLHLPPKAVRNAQCKACFSWIFTIFQTHPSCFLPPTIASEKMACA